MDSERYLFMVYDKADGTGESSSLVLARDEDAARMRWRDEYMHRALVNGVPCDVVFDYVEVVVEPIANDDFVWLNGSVRARLLGKP